MKFTTAIIFVLANGIAAMPWAAKSSESQGVSNEEDITLHIKVSQSPMHEDAVHASMFDACLRVCWPATPQCPKGWYSNNLGTGSQPCWTCCKAPDDARLQL